MRISQKLLDVRLRASLEHHQVPAEDAALTIETLIRAEREGAKGHGLARFAAMTDRLRTGLTNPHPTFARVQEAPGSAVLDADDALGQVAAATGMAIAMEKASACGIGYVAVRNSSHYGRAGDAALIAAERGYVGLSGSNASPRLVAEPGARRLLGNNPLAFACPGPTHPVLIDVSPGITTTGSIRRALLEGRSIPASWALDEGGEPTTDPERAMAGAMLGVGGHKGWVLALMVDLLAGVLSGGAIADEVGATQNLRRPQHVSHMFIAMDIQAFVPMEEFVGRVGELRGKVEASGGQSTHFPGDRRNAMDHDDDLDLSTPLVEAIDAALAADRLPGLCT